MKFLAILIVTMAVGLYIWGHYPIETEPREPIAHILEQYGNVAVYGDSIFLMTYDSSLSKELLVLLLTASETHKVSVCTN